MASSRFDDETLHEARRPRAPVAAAKPTPRARHKKACRRIDDGMALHSFYTLLGELATRWRHPCRVLSDPTAPACSLFTQPTETQRRVADLTEMCPAPGPPES